MTKSPKRPNSMRHLDDAIRRECGGGQDAYVRLRTLMANAIVAQMLPDGVVKGGSAIKMRYGNAKTRYTTDLDTATAMDPAEYAETLGEALGAGWEGFTGRVVARRPARPRDVPQEYVMRPFDVRLSYLGKPWCTVPLEVGHNEIGDAEVADWVELSDAAEAFVRLGFPAPGKAPLMQMEYQVAQKLHALTGGGDRVRDLVDLQVILANSEIDLAETRRVCERLFAYRQAQGWPPTVTSRVGWVEQYQAQAIGLPILKDLDQAIAWANTLVSAIRDAAAVTRPSRSRARRSPPPGSCARRGGRGSLGPPPPAP